MDEDQLHAKPALVEGRRCNVNMNEKRHHSFRECPSDASRSHRSPRGLELPLKFKRRQHHVTVYSLSLHFISSGTQPRQHRASHDTSFIMAPRNRERKDAVDALVCTANAATQASLTMERTRKAERILDFMLDDVAMDIALQAHRELVLAQRPCPTCQTR
jgi:hypothetical protein